ncbi:uncharacterized protein LOC143210335 [Lasioglossum baleicum]|uniref:uncharacterized protein LOC143210335 n=1 Tax=Lasioglossum baleicum TaxID=434251 RepID=UPI003FCE9C05
MKKLQILRVDNDLVEKANLQIGDNIIGRSVATERGKSQIDKYAATINLSPNNEMTITPVASCFLKSCETSRWKLLKLGTTVSIKPGDICSLISDKCWFKIVPVPSTMEINKENAMKRKAEGDVNCEIPDKMHCSKSGEGDNARSFNNVPNDTLTDNNNTITGKNEEICTIKEDLSNRIAVIESTDQNVENTDASSSNNSNKMQASNTTKQNNAHTSEQANEQNVPANTTSKTHREKCKYREKCYRKNAQHKAEYSHPVDPDYNIPDNRKECRYGTKCYRISSEHREEYKHTPKPTNAANNGGNRSRRTAQSLLNALSDLEDSSADDSEEESVDESEYDPISEEEYSDYNEHFGESDSDSDWDWDDDYLLLY